LSEPTVAAATTSSEARLLPLSFDDLDGWRSDDLAAALGAFRRGADALLHHPPKTRALGIDAGALANCLRHAARLSAEACEEAARQFFEAAFAPFEVAPAAGGGFFTGYYEPEVAGSLAPTPRFKVPLHRRPDDLVEIAAGDQPPGLDHGLRFARKTEAGLREYPDRAAIMAGCLAGRGLELVYVADPIDAFFIHIQGAARVRLEDGRVMRVTYAGKTGHPYTPIGRALVEMGALAKDKVTMQTIRAWLRAHPGEAGSVMARNRSYVFFREAPVDDARLGPIAAAKVPLTAGRSLAVDRRMHSFHTPIWIETTLPDGRAWRRLMIAQDTGSAIVGPARGDIFFGSGEEPGEIAGAMRAGGRFVVLAPRGVGP
jgi:membrane-bound lytic murein transglycosylase A